MSLAATRCAVTYSASKAVAILTENDGPREILLLGLGFGIKSGRLCRGKGPPDHVTDLLVCMHCN